MVYQNIECYIRKEDNVILIDNLKRKYDESHSTFGGLIYLADFDTSRPVGDIAERIERDIAFDNQCIKNSMLRDLRNQSKNNDTQN